MGGAALGVLYLMETSGFGDSIFPNLKSYVGFHLWMPVLPPLAVCAAGQLLGDILNIKAINDSGFFTFLKQILFIGVTVFMTVWYVFSFETDYSVKITGIESAFVSLGMIGPIFVYLAYAVSYIVWAKKKLYPFFFIISSAVAILIDYLLAMLWAEGGFWVAIGLFVLSVVLWFAKPDERIFEEYNDAPIDSKKVAEELAYLDHIPSGLEDDYDKNGNYVGAKCKNCAYYKPFYDQYGFLQPYCRHGNHTDCHEYGYCGYYKKNYE